VTGRSTFTGPALVTLALLLALRLAATPVLGQAATPPPAAPASTAKTKAPGAQKPEYPLHISAAQMEADQDQRLIAFKGQVKADYGDSTLYADKLLIFYKPDEKKPGEKGPAAAAPAAKGQATPQASPLGGLGGDKVDRIEAWGNVRYVQEDRVATGEKAIYTRDKDEIVLLGHPQVWRGQDHLKGSRITINLATKKMDVESSPEQRVEAHLYQAAQEGKGPGEAPAPGASRAVPRTGRRR
jgi:lipopolysaccharide export system protein LptA